MTSPDDSVNRFNGLAALYQRHRPTYPPAAIDWIMTTCGLGPDSLLVDVGAGTGIASRLFAARGVPVIGIEPNAQMRGQAEATPAETGQPTPRYQEGRGEATGLADGVASVVLCAQAFHWFDPDLALAEFQRILRPGGWVALMWNERAETDPFTAAYGAVIQSIPAACGVEQPRTRAGEALLTSPLFPGASARQFANEQVLDEESLLGRTFSMSFVPRGGAEAERLAAELLQLFQRHQQAGQVVLRYETTVYLGQKRVAL